MRDTYTEITHLRNYQWPSDDDVYSQLGSANGDQSDEYDFYFDPEPDIEGEDYNV